MKSYVINFNGSGETCEGYFDSDSEAESWVGSVLEQHGYDIEEIVSCDWQQEGINDDGEKCYRMLFWASEEDADNDPGVNSVCQLCKIGD